MAHLLANMAFNTEISAAMAHQMTKAAESMTYRQLCILQLSATKENFDLRKRSYEGEESFPKNLYQIIYEYYDLYKQRAHQTWASTWRQVQQKSILARPHRRH